MAKRWLEALSGEKAQIDKATFVGQLKSQEWVKDMLSASLLPSALNPGVSPPIAVKEGKGTKKKKKPRKVVSDLDD